MISPVVVSQYSRAEDNQQRGLARLSRVLRSEIIELTHKENSISIGFTISNHGTGPKTIYGDGSSEPEVYTDHADWYNFDASDYLNYFDKSEDILMRVIRSELRKALQEFLRVTQVPDTLLRFCLEKNEKSTLEITDKSKANIKFCMI
ncbi:hypothetical protein TcWFU_000651 [Taenia crassiceps]|uniref:Uncharacterized protein n=1 Tax=Taenia crassiceps TaxID=6207 RepID=A0ABR4QNT6_9CEST